MFDFQLRGTALTCVRASQYNNGRVFNLQVLDEGLPGNPDVEYVNANSSLIQFEQEEKLRHLQEMIVGLMVGLGIEGKVRRKKGYFKIHYEDKDEIGERVTGHIIHPPAPEQCGQCGTQYYPHLIPHSGLLCFVCLESTDDIHVHNEKHVHESASGFGAEELRRINEAKSFRMRERMRRGVEEP